MLACPLVLLLAAAPARADVDRPPDAAVLLADGDALRSWLLAHDPVVAEGAASVRQAEAEVRVARGHENPSVDVSAAVAPVQRNPADLSAYDTLLVNVGLDLPFDVAGRAPRVASARQALLSAEAGRDDVLIGRLAQAREALATLVWTEARGRLADERLADAREIRAMEQRRFDLGDASGIDLDRVALEADRLGREASAAHADVAAARARCTAVLVAPCTVGDATLGALDALTVPAAPTADPAALPAVRALETAATARELAARAAVASAMPDPTLRLGYTRDRLVYAGNQPHMVGAGLTFDLPVLRQGRAEADAARAEAAALSARADATARGVEADVAGLRARLASLDERLAQVDGVELPRADAVVEATRVAWVRGERSLTDLLLARRELGGLQLEGADLRLERFLARAALRRALALDLAAPEAP